MSGVSALSLCSAATGKLAELRVIELLLERGHKVALPVVDDDGVDLVVDYRIRVQVKSSTGAANFGVSLGRRYRGCVYNGIRPSKADVFVLHVVDPCRWFVVPAGEFSDLRDGATFSLSLQGAYGRGARVMAYEDAWEVFDGYEGVSVAGDRGGAGQVAGGGGDGQLQLVG